MALCRPATDGFGVPVISFLVYFIWFPFPVSKTFVICTCVVLFYFLLAMMGYTLPVLYRSFSGLSAGKTYRASVVVPALSAIKHTYRGRQYGET
jgi:hypothetical protein